MDVTGSQSRKTIYVSAKYTTLTEMLDNFLISLSFKRPSSELQESFKRASRELQENFKRTSREIQESFKGVSRELQ